MIEMQNINSAVKESTLRDRHRRAKNKVLYGYTAGSPERVAAINKRNRGYYLRAPKRVQDVSTAHTVSKWDWHLKYTYGISRDQYLDMVLGQAGECAVCDKQCRRLDVDHNHSSGSVRGLLCSRCNTGLGFMENSVWVQKAEKYLSHKAGR